MYCGALIDQSLAMNRRRDDEGEIKSEVSIYLAIKIFKFLQIGCLKALSIWNLSHVVCDKWNRIINFISS